MLIEVPEHLAADLAAWRALEREDAVRATLARSASVVTKAVEAIQEFAVGRRGYVGVSWGKDSVVVAHLVALAGVDWPLVWVRVEPIVNPHCALVRDAFLKRYPVRYEEIEVWCTRDDKARDWHAKGTLERGFAEAERKHGEHYISGVRGEESGIRKLRMMRFGHSTETTCAPIGWWTGADVFAHLHAYDLPVHPAYAMSLGGALPRDRLRVASLGGKRGDGMGRAEWESRYYRDALARLRSASTRKGMGSNG